MATLLFITIAGNTVGLGHLNRCLSLAEHAALKNLSSQFLLFADNEAALRIKDAGHDCFLYPISAFTSQCVKACLDKIGTIAAVIIDFSHPIVLQQEEKIQASLSYIHDEVQDIILIDSMGKHALTTKLPNIPVSVVVVPYVGAALQKNAAWRYLAGSTYAVLSSVYAGLANRIVNKKANRVLISCGGSDPKNLTLLALRGIEALSEKLNVRVIVGPLFDKHLKMNLKNTVEDSKHCITLMDAPQTLVSHMLWCDLAIATSGLTKYELAATGTPAILLSMDEVDHLINQPFAALGSTLDLGVEVTAELIAEQVSQLLANYNARVRMAMRGHQAVDGNGAKRLIAETIRKRF
jgi:spore coat polysaccharide biosynthesis predicted glycosyltransferase SpsG